MPDTSRDPRTWLSGKPGSTQPLMAGIPKNNLSYLLAARGIPRGYLGAKAGLKGSYESIENRVAEWIQGRRNLPNRRVIQIAHLLGVSPLYVLDLSSRNDELAENVTMPRNANVTGVTEFREALQSDLELLEDGQERVIRSMRFDRLAADDNRYIVGFNGCVSMVIEQVSDDIKHEALEAVRCELMGIVGDYRDLSKLAKDAIDYHTERKDHALNWYLAETLNTLNAKNREFHSLTHA